jgi:putative acyl-CoA dehydrogenase
MTPLATHEVTNQAPPLAGFDAFATDRALTEAVEREGAGWAKDRLSAMGRIAGSADTREKARLANAHEPVLKTHDRYGKRVNFVEYHPAWHDLMKIGIAHQLHSLPWAEPQPGVHVARGAAF